MTKIILVILSFGLISCNYLQKYSRVNPNSQVKILEENRNYRELADLYHKNSKKAQLDTDSLYKAAENYRLAKNYDLAIELYQQLLGLNDKHIADSYEGLILSYLELGSFEKATNLVSKIISIDASRWRPINAIAIVFALHNNYDKAIEYYDLALDIERHYSILNNKALTMAFNNDIKNALYIMEEAVNIIPANDQNKAKIIMNLALLYGISGYLEKSEEILKPFLSSSQIYNNLAIYSILNKDHGKAKTYLVKALDYDNHYQKAENNLKLID